MLLLLLLSCTPPPADTAPGHAYRLTHRQWESTVVDLLGLSEPSGLSETFVSDPSVSTFDTDPSSLAVPPVLWLQYQLAAEALAVRVVEEEGPYAVVVPAGLRPDGPAYTRAERDAWLLDFGGRAFRRPLDGEELMQLGRLFDAGASVFASGDPFVDGVQAAVTGALQAPGFLYRTEGLQPGGEPGELSPEELASRLSYALWNTMPDAELLAAAEADGLGPETLRAQAERLLDDPRGHAAVADLHRQLLHIDSYAQIVQSNTTVLDGGGHGDPGGPPSPEVMQAEVYAFVDDLFYTEGALRDLLTSPDTFATGELAAVYGVEGVEGPELQPVTLDPTQRAGLLTLSGFLAWQANSSEPNLIERGYFINDALLCAEVPPPPPGATPLPTDAEAETLRERVEAHTSGCGGNCHNALINPVGFALGRYDKDGRYAEQEGRGEAATPIDASGSYTFADGTFTFDGAVELAEIMADREEVHRCYMGHLTGYLTARPVAEVDGALLDALTASSQADRPLRSLVLDIVTDPSFRRVRP